MLCLRAVHFTHRCAFPAGYAAVCLMRLVAAGQHCTHLDPRLAVEKFVARKSDAKETRGMRTNVRDGGFNSRPVCAEGEGDAEDRTYFSPLAEEGSLLGSGKGSASQRESALFQHEKMMESSRVEAKVMDRLLDCDSLSNVLDGVERDCIAGWVGYIVSGFSEFCAQGESCSECVVEA
ncbi:hypothetical protein IOCL1545_000657200 [Leishmania shawi]|uniref:Uncharacterized protein n=1 Tax=Leishmania shawi TaxID=5680 RepID=A0ABR3E2S6_9TRYP